MLANDTYSKHMTLTHLFLFLFSHEDTFAKCDQNQQVGK